MQAADRRLVGHYNGIAHPEAYTAQFYPDLHKVDPKMQQAVFAQLKARLADAPG